MDKFNLIEATFAFHYFRGGYDHVDTLHLFTRCPGYRWS